MKYPLLFSAVCITILSACTSKKSNNLAIDTTASDTVQNYAEPGHVCFLHTDGTSNQDSTKIHLVIAGNRVSGEMNWIPAGKDSRKGTLAGTQDGNIITATWTFMQEGMKDTIAVEFEYPGDKLKQKPFIVNEKTGRQQTDDNAGYTIIFDKAECED